MPTDVLLIMELAIQSVAMSLLLYNVSVDQAPEIYLFFFFVLFYCKKNRKLATVSLEEPTCSNTLERFQQKFVKTLGI